MKFLNPDLSAARICHDAYQTVPANPGYDEVIALPSCSHDKKIAYGDHEDQFGLLWLPKSGKPNRKPTLVLVHGGCWLRDYDISHTAALATALSQAGYPVWNIEYRRASEQESAWPTSLQDLRLGMAALDQLSESGIANDEMVILGHSAGGHLALLLAAEAEQLFPTGTPSVSMVGLAAITDIAHYATGHNSCQQSTVLFMGGTPDEVPEAYAAANPAARHINIPVTLLHGDADQIVPLDQFNCLEEHNITRVLEPGAGHFDWVHPGTPAFKTLLRTIE